MRVFCFGFPGCMCMVNSNWTCPIDFTLVRVYIFIMWPVCSCFNTVPLITFTFIPSHRCFAHKRRNPRATRSTHRGVCQCMVAGSPCTDYSFFGARRGKSGPTSICLIVLSGPQLGNTIHTINILCQHWKPCSEYQAGAAEVVWHRHTWKRYEVSRGAAHHIFRLIGFNVVWYVECLVGKHSTCSIQSHICHTLCTQVRYTVCRSLTWIPTCSHSPSVVHVSTWS